MANANKSLSKRNKYFLIFGFLFFVNPMPLGLDFIPDVFGCILIYFGLTQLAYFDGAIEKAQKLSFYMLVVEAVKLVFMKPIYLTEIGATRMLGVTAFSLVEIVLYYMFFKQFHEGVSYFSMRNNCNKTLAKCDGCAFLSTFSVVAKITASLLPELLALLDQEKYFSTDFKTIDTINSIMSAKPLLVVLLSMLSLIVAIAWYISICGLLKLLHSEGGTEIDARYVAEYSSKPQLVRPKKLRRASLAAYFSLVFLIDAKIDGIPLAPIWATFFFLFVAAFLFEDLLKFDAVKSWSIPAFALLLGADLFKRSFVPYGAIVLYETPIKIVIANTAIAIVTSVACLLCVRGFLLGLSRLSKELGGDEISITAPWIAFSISMILWAVGYAVPYFYSYVASWRLIAAAVFVWKTASIITQINDEEAYRASLENTNHRD